MGRRPKMNGPCGWCHHDMSMHQYVPGGGRHDGPKNCTAVGCVCKEYVRPLSALRRQRALLVENQSAVGVIDVGAVNAIDVLIARVQEHQRAQRRARGK